MCHLPASKGAGLGAGGTGLGGMSQGEGTRKSQQLRHQGEGTRRGGHRGHQVEGARKGGRAGATDAAACVRLGERFAGRRFPVILRAAAMRTPGRGHPLSLQPPHPLMCARENAPSGSVPEVFAESSRAPLPRVHPHAPRRLARTGARRVAPPSVQSTAAAHWRGLAVDSYPHRYGRGGPVTGGVPSAHARAFPAIASAESAEVRKASIHAGFRPMVSAERSAEVRKSGRLLVRWRPVGSGAPVLSAGQPAVNRPSSNPPPAHWRGFEVDSYPRRQPREGPSRGGRHRKHCRRRAFVHPRTPHGPQLQREGSPAAAPSPGGRIKPGTARPAHSSTSPRTEDPMRYTVTLSAPGGLARVPKCLPSPARCPRSRSRRNTARSL